MHTSETESKRMAALRRYAILDTPPDGNFDGITSLAARLLNVPIALTSLVDTDRIWFKSKHGLDVAQIDREPGLCASAILDGEPYVVEDAEFDPRTLANPLVAGEFGLRFYAAVPLTTVDNHRLGTLCVLDKVPRKLSDEDMEILKTLAGLVMDQMELRLASRRVEEKNQQLAQMIEEKDHFLAMAIHDLRNPLGSTMMMANLLAEKKVGPLTEKQEQFITCICDSSTFMLQLVNDFLNFSAAGSDRLRLEKVLTNIGDLLKSSLKDQGSQAEAKSILLELVADNDVPEILVDPYQIRRVFANLLDNAIKFSPPGGRVEARLSFTGHQVAVEVSDEGLGIQTSEIRKLFKPFSVTSVKPTAGEKSTGLGLAITSRLVEAHGGEIKVIAEPGRGATFRLLLPKNARSSPDC